MNKVYYDDDSLTCRYQYTEPTRKFKSNVTIKSNIFTLRQKQTNDFHSNMFPEKNEEVVRNHSENKEEFNEHSVFHTSRLNMQVVQCVFRQTTEHI